MLTSILTSAGAVHTSSPHANSKMKTEAKTVEMSSTDTVTTQPQATAPAAANGGQQQQGASATFPNSQYQLEWARWTPDPALIAGLQGTAAAGDPSSHGQQSASAGRMAGLSGATAASSATEQLGLIALRVPELTMANLQWLAEELQSAGRHVAALPVLQLARLIATVTMRDQVGL